jgi:hypothetical protein
MKTLLRSRLGSRLAFLAILVTALLVLQHGVFERAAHAKPCCQTCPSWPDLGEGWDWDPCARNCYICGTGSECWLDEHCSPGYSCVSGYCVS